MPTELALQLRGVEQVREGTAFILQDCGDRNPEFSYQQALIRLQHLFPLRSPFSLWE